MADSMASPAWAVGQVTSCLLPEAIRLKLAAVHLASDYSTVSRRLKRMHQSC
jgi:hypothetical protein